MNLKHVMEVVDFIIPVPATRLAVSYVSVESIMKNRSSFVLVSDEDEDLSLLLFFPITVEETLQEFTLILNGRTAVDCG